MAWTKEQEQAINEKGTNIIVSAGAGSGKTAVLTARTMRILKEGVHVNELLILTFTKAAAGEMKERIRKSIKKSIEESPSLAKELELIDQAYITTFDSFALSVVKKYHYLLNISNKIALTEASIIDMQKVKIMDEVFDSYYDKASDKFTKLIYDFCVKDDSDLKKAILKIATKIDGLPNREEYINDYMNQHMTQEYTEQIMAEYEELLAIKKEEIKRQLDNLALLTDGTYIAKVEEALSSLFTCKTIDDYYIKIGFIKVPILPRGSEDEVKDQKEKLNDSIKDLKEIVFKYGNKDNILESLNIMKDYVEIIIDIIKTYLNKFHEYKENNDIYDFQDIALLSIKVLKENESVRQELKETFKEIMIDEYQDTNDIQETFISMIENHNVYMVGDIKQSIYRFRNANPYIFKNKYDNYAQHNNGIKIDLVKNFRSRLEVLDNINEIFNLIMDNIIGGAEYHESHQMVYGNTSYIEEGKTDYNYNCQILEYEQDEKKKYSKEEIEIFTIANDIKSKIQNKYQVFNKDDKVLRDITYSDFVILMDRTTDFDLYKKIFEYLGIPLTLYKDDNLKVSDDIYILKNIIDYIVKINQGQFDTEFKYDYVSIARSYLFELDDDEIFKSFKDNDFKNNIVYETLAPLSKEISHLSINGLLEKIVEVTDMYQKFIKVGDVVAASVRISKMFDVAKNLSELGFDIYKFRDYLSELLNSDYDMKYNSLGASSNSVKIMTIHKSKGLEYHVCYYSGLYKSFNISDLKERFLLDNKYGIITPYFKEGINESILKYLVKYHYLEEEVSEKIRLFYVALTRAKETMILLTPKIEEVDALLDDNGTIDITLRRKYKSFSDILNSIKTKLIKYYQEIDLKKINLTKEYLFSNKALNKIQSSILDNFEVQELENIEEPEISSSTYSKKLHQLIDKETRNNIKLGLEIHEILEYLDLKRPNLDIIENKFIKNKIAQFLQLDILKDIDKTKIYKEYEFIYTNQLIEYHGIIDLMIEYQDRIDIIDYKLSDILDENYVSQLKGYKEYIEKLTNKEINIYLYSIINGILKKL